MTQPHLLLHHFPGACSQVSICALEMAGLRYDLRLVDLIKGAQSMPDYLRISPLGKVPLLLIDGEPLSENMAILTYIAGLRPDAGLFPANPSPRLYAEAIGGLSFCAGTLHPQIRGIANPMRITSGDEQGVRAKSTELTRKSFTYAEERLGTKGWWLGDWSIVDVYLNWAFGVASRAGFDAAPFPRLASLPDRMAAIPAFSRMQDIEGTARAELGL